jgi:hypothetical protein
MRDAQRKAGAGRMRTLKLLVFLVVVACVGLVGYGYFGDMTAPQREITIDLAPRGGG